MGAFTENTKTILSVDFDRQSTCLQFCDYCYVSNMERIYPTYLNKITKNSVIAKTNPQKITDSLNLEYKKYRSSKSKKYNRLDKLPVRIYGSGDYLPIHLKVLKQLEFKFFIISKNVIRKNLVDEIPKLLNLKNLTNLVLSLDDQNVLGGYQRIKQYYGSNRISFAYTGMADSFKQWKDSGLLFDIFFNISKKKVECEKSKLYKEQCPCDSGMLKLAKSCTFCSKCWRSSETKGKQWNTL